MEQGLQKNKDLFIFTIQNVPIKFSAPAFHIVAVGYLQYKMFLLNLEAWKTFRKKREIYNTKCSY